MGKDRSSEEKEDNLKFRVKYSAGKAKYMTKAARTGLRNATRSPLDLGAKQRQGEAGHFTSCWEEDNPVSIPLENTEPSRPLMV